MPTNIKLNFIVFASSICILVSITNIMAISSEDVGWLEVCYD